MTKRDEIHAQLQALAKSVARESRLEVAAGPIYALASIAAGERRVRCQIVSSAYLPPELKLDEQGGARLRALDYAKGSGQRNWTKQVVPSAVELERLADEIIEVFTRVHGCRADELETILVHDDTPHPENPELIDAMTALAAKNGDPEARHRMYNALLNATFLVPLAPEPDAAADAGEEFLVLERIEGRPVFGVFTDWASLQLWNPRTWPYVPVHGSELFEIAHALSLALLQINPRGNTGGQLFAHEVETLARAMQDWTRKHSN